MTNVHARGGFQASAQADQDEIPEIERRAAEAGRGGRWRARRRDYDSTSRSPDRNHAHAQECHEACRLGHGWGCQASVGRAPGRAAAGRPRGRGEGAASDDLMGSSGAEGAHMRLPAHVQLGRRRRAALRSSMSMPAASTASLDLHGHTRRGDECTREVQRLASVNRCGQCVP